MDFIAVIERSKQHEKPSIAKDSDYNITSNTVYKAEKEAEKVLRILEKIHNLQTQLYNLKQETNWSNYLGENSLSQLTQHESIKLCEALETIKYAYQKSLKD